MRIVKGDARPTPGPTPEEDAMEWWTQQAAGWIGGGVGAGIGLLGGLIGVLGGLCVPKGKAKPLVLALFAIMIGAGAISLIAGVVALIDSQPYHVFYPLLLIGLIACGVGGGNLPFVLKAYRQAEARRMDAEELRRG
ncbi:MAG: hypothetical protein R3B68_16625 [Phycisphaerales bacterium]